MVVKIPVIFWLAKLHSDVVGYHIGGICCHFRVKWIYKDVSTNSFMIFLPTF